MFFIRPFQPEDFNDIIKIEWEIFKEHDPHMYMELYETVSDGFYVAVHQHVITGFVVGFISMPGKGRIFTLAVREKYRRLGIGSNLMDTIISILWKKGAQDISLEVRLQNIAAQQFYLKHGFVPEWVEKGYYNDGENALVMKKKNITISI
ncbi:MAG: ribosomal protein S18-alanine N-acetyltransferase [Methanosarcinales archaeon]|nr:ribosomal protein S18-alanine N-acetyltransferase [Methanosarcinales archaeon]